MLKCDKTKADGHFSSLFCYVVKRTEGGGSGGRNRELAPGRHVNGDKKARPDGFSIRL